MIGCTLARLSAVMTYSSNRVVLFGVGPYERRNFTHAPEGAADATWFVAKSLLKVISLLPCTGRKQVAATLDALAPPMEKGFASA